MKAIARLSPPNSLLLLLDDPCVAELPESFDGRSIAWTPTCIAVATLCEVDGKTSIVLTDDESGGASDHAMRRAFKGELSTPGMEVHVRTVTMESVAKLTVSEERVEIEVWTNDDRGPDQVLVIVRPTSRRTASSR